MVSLESTNSYVNGIAAPGNGKKQKARGTMPVRPKVIEETSSVPVFSVCA